MNFKDKLELLIEEKGISVPTISKATGISSQTIYGILKRGGEKTKFSHLKKLSVFFDVSLDYLVDDNTLQRKPPQQYKEHPLLEKYISLDPHGKEAVDSILNVELERIKKVEQEQADLSCGLCQVIKFPVQEYEEKVCAGTGNYLDYTTAFITELDYEPPKGADFIVPVQGHSMEPTISDGDRLFIQRTKELNYGDIGIFYVPCDGLVVKEYTPEGLKAHNGEYTLVKGNSDIEVIGKVIGKVRE